MKLFHVILLIHFVSCSTYLNNRRKDAQDIVTIGGEKPSYGFGMRLSYFTFGFFFQGGETEEGKRDLGSGFGMRGGSLAGYHSQQLVFGVLGGESFYSGAPELDDKENIVYEEKVPVVLDKRDNLKTHNVRYLNFYNDQPTDRQKRNKDLIKKELATDLITKLNDPSYLSYLPPEKKKPNGHGISYPFQAEIFFGAYYSLRLGFNIAEFADFILGFTTIDILEDDSKD